MREALPHHESTVSPKTPLQTLVEINLSSLPPLLPPFPRPPPLPLLLLPSHPPQVPDCCPVGAETSIRITCQNAVEGLVARLFGDSFPR